MANEGKVWRVPGHATGDHSPRTIEAAGLSLQHVIVRRIDEEDGPWINPLRSPDRVPFIVRHQITDALSKGDTTSGVIAYVGQKWVWQVANQ